MATTSSIPAMTNLLLILLLLIGCSETTVVEAEDVHGCLDSQACNYNADATIFNNSCIYLEDKIAEGYCSCDNDIDADEDGICDDVDDCVGAYDCFGVCNGDAVYDDCGICDGDDTIFDFKCQIDLDVLQDFTDLNGWSSYSSEVLFQDVNWTESLPYKISSISFFPQFLGYELNTIPESIGQLTELTNFLISDANNVSSIPESIGQLNKLESIQINDSQISTFPSSIFTLDLINFKFNTNTITSIPNEICDLSNLEYIELMENQLVEIPSCIGNLSNLRRLALDYNNLTSIPESLCNLPSSPYCQIGFHSNQLCEEYQYDCIEEKGWYWGDQDCQE